MRLTVLAIVLGLLSSFITAVALADEKQVTFYSTYGFQKGDQWLIPLRIWVHEPPDALRNAAAAAIGKKLAARAGIEELSDEQEALFRQRSYSFIADSESGERVVFRFDADPEQKDWHLTGDDGREKTDFNGILEGIISVPNTAINQLLAAQTSETGWLTFRAHSKDHAGIGRVRLIPPEGLSVISDIDDTIKVTNIPGAKPRF